MNRTRAWQAALSCVVVLSTFPGALRAAAHFDAYELVWLIPFLPAFTAVFFGIVITMVELFVQADSYKNPDSILFARRFLRIWDGFFFLILAFFEAAAFGVFWHFRP